MDLKGTIENIGLLTILLFQASLALIGNRVPPLSDVSRSSFQHKESNPYFTISVRDRREAQGLIRESVLEEDLEELRNNTYYPILQSSWSFYKRAILPNSTPSQARKPFNAVSEDGGDWSPCSFSCGIGISHRLRTCRASDKNCRQYMVEYKLCNTQTCPKSENPQDQDFRYHQCKSFDQTPYRGRLFQWVPFENVRNPCSLTCQARGYNFVVVFSPKALDGTRCNNNSLDVCINGKCRDVGCDLKLGSTKKVDSCGVCGGDNSKCRRTLYYWQETDYSACSASCGGGYQMTSSFCKMMKPSKVVPSYFCEPKARPAPKIRSCAQQDCPPKWFADDWGPCPKKCGFSKQSRNVYCAQELKNKSLITVKDHRCHGHKPEQQKQCQLKKCSYWKTGFWSPCTVTCGNGIRMLELKCIGPEGGLSDECEEKDKPPHIETCSTNVSCIDEEKEGDKIIMTNSLAKDEPNEIFPSFEDSNDIVTNKPTNYNIKNEISKPLATYSPNLMYLFRPDFRYVVSDWGQCSEVCGKEGFRIRSVKCKVYYPYTQIMVEVPEDQCRGVFKPPAKESCNERNCQKDSPARVGVEVEENKAASFTGDLPFAAASTSNQDSFTWKYRGFSDCSAKCLGGIQDSIILCVRENDGNVFDDNHCDLSRRPPPFQRTCNEYACPPRWEVSEYSTCSHSCGGGIQTRSVRCLHQTAKGKVNIYVVPPEMCPEPRPESKKVCNNIDCPPFWAVGNWSECSKSCEGKGIQRRPIYCQQVTAAGHVAYMVDESACVAASEKPAFIRECKPDLSPVQLAECSDNRAEALAPYWQSPPASNSILTNEDQNQRFSPWYDPLSTVHKVSEQSESNVYSYPTLTPLSLIAPSDENGIQQNDAAPMAMPSNANVQRDRTKSRNRSKGRGKGKGKLRKMLVRVKSQKSQIMVPKGTFLKMKCNFKRELMTMPITWTKNGVTINPSNTATDKNPNASRIVISKFGALKIKNVKGKDAGKYDCQLGDQFKKTIVVKVIPPRKDWSEPFNFNMTSATPSKSTTLTRWDNSNGDSKGLHQNDQASNTNYNDADALKPLYEEPDPVEQDVSTSKVLQPWNVETKPVGKLERDLIPTNLERHVSVFGTEKEQQEGINIPGDDYENYIIDTDTSSRPSKYHSTRYAVALPKLGSNQTLDRSVPYGLQKIYYITKPFSTSPSYLQQPVSSSLSKEKSTIDSILSENRATVDDDSDRNADSSDVNPELLYWQSYGWTRCSQSCGGRGIQIQVSLCHRRLIWEGANQNGHDMGQRLMQRYLSYAEKKIKKDPLSNSLTDVLDKVDDNKSNEVDSMDLLGQHYKIIDDDYCQKAGLKRPPKFRRCGDGECPKWKTETWQQCKLSPCESLNVAVQERRVYCAYSNGSLASRSSYNSPGCKMLERPPMRKECFNDKCKASWITSNWSPCSKSCGNGGITTRVIHCAWFNTTKSAGSHCIDQPRPETVKSCQELTHCPPVNINDSEVDACKDHSMYCGVTRRLHLCNVGDYKVRCCKTCSNM